MSEESLQWFTFMGRDDLQTNEVIHNSKDLPVDPVLVGAILKNKAYVKSMA
ncbi:hypothetical protein N0K47_004867 [Escherichia coli]|nr:hypothetical protein [Escherichia coli]EIH6899962.1 hypothetical protein [Escherichia coli]EIZ6394009.1 hypothetical protein [Escherichia coli]EJQ5432791.1 hypothetical protein [Escherichia coli]